MRITEEHIEAFAKLTGDRNPLHFDPDFARRMGFDGRIAHGMLTSALISTLIGEDLPGRGAIFLEQRVRYLAPVYPGQTITGELEVTNVRADKPVVTLAARISRDDGTAVCDGEVVVRLREPHESGQVT
jgi:3-hydroxybutyryl-CoA dehydratase